MLKFATRLRHCVDKPLTGECRLHLIPRMSFLRPVFHFVAPLVIATATLAAGCTQPYKSIACTANTDTGCPTIDQVEHLTFDDAGIAYQIVNGQPVETGVGVPTDNNGNPIVPQCCVGAGACVMQSSGCDSGYRYIAKHSGGGYDVSICVDKSAMCAEELASVSPDMAQ